MQPCLLADFLIIKVLLLNCILIGLTNKFNVVGCKWKIGFGEDEKVRMGKAVGINLHV